MRRTLLRTQIENRVKRKRPSPAAWAALAVFIGIVAVAGAHSGATANQSAVTAPTDAPRHTDLPAFDTGVPSPPDSPVVAQAPPDAPAASPQPLAPADPCHHGGVTYCTLNPAVTQVTIDSTICVSGWTATVRPAKSYTEDLKREQIAAERLPGGLRSYEEDHRMPLELGGSPADTANLSPESPPSPNPKDADETRLRNAVCAGALTLAAAQEQLVSTWLSAYPGYRE